MMIASLLLVAFAAGPAPSCVPPDQKLQVAIYDRCFGMPSRGRWREWRGGDYTRLTITAEDLAKGNVTVEFGTPDEPVTEPCGLAVLDPETGGIVFWTRLRHHGRWHRIGPWRKA